MCEDLPSLHFWLKEVQLYCSGGEECRGKVFNWGRGCLRADFRAFPLIWWKKMLLKISSLTYLLGRRHGNQLALCYLQLVFNLDTGSNQSFFFGKAPMEGLCPLSHAFSGQIFVFNCAHPRHFLNPGHTVYYLWFIFKCLLQKFSILSTCIIKRELLHSWVLS